MGVVLWEMLVGKNPFEDSPADEILARVRDPSLPPILTVDPSVPTAVAAVVDRALSPEPFRRFATAEEMRSRLSACLSEMAPDVGPEVLGRYLTHLFRVEFERERELLARISSRGESLSFDPDSETQVLTVEAETTSGPHASTEVIHAATSYPWPRRPYLPEEHLDYERPTVPPPTKRRRWWIGALAVLPVAAALAWWALPTEAPLREVPQAAPTVEATLDEVPEPAPPPAPREPTPPEPRDVEIAAPVYGTGPLPPPPERTIPRRPPAAPSEPLDENAARKARLAERWRALLARYQKLVALHGEERVGTIVEQMVEAAQTSVDRFIDHPDEYDTLDAQLEALGDLVRERENALR
jgi:serine/threonine-protein kinase